MLHLGDSSNAIWHSRFDGTEWSPNEEIEEILVMQEIGELFTEASPPGLDDEVNPRSGAFGHTHVFGLDPA